MEHTTTGGQLTKSNTRVKNTKERYMVKSMASSGKEGYIPIQLRVNGGRLHIQAAGSEGNRTYGFALDSEADVRLVDWLMSVSKPLPSLANSGRSYTAAQARASDNNEVHVQVAGEALNRSYGASFDLTGEDANGFSEWLEHEASYRDDTNGDDSSDDNDEDDGDEDNRTIVATLA